MSISITRLTEAEKSQFTMVVSELMAQRKTLFGNRLSDHLPDDLRNFDEHYVANPRAGFCLAQTSDGAIVGNIAFRPYDHRFDLAGLEGNKIVEVMKLYVHPLYRRQHLASQLLSTLKHTAQSRGIDYLYLHTHPALTGAVNFWEKQGFQHLKTDNVGIWSGDWQIIHMGLALA